MEKLALLSEFAAINGYRFDESNSLIRSFLKLSGNKMDSEYIPEEVVPVLKKALTYWLNLNESEEKNIRIEKYSRGFHNVLYDALTNNQPIQYLLILCPSYRKGKLSIGIKEPGQTTYVAYNNGKNIKENTLRLGIPCELKCFFYDIAIENAEKFTEKDWNDLETNILINKVIARVHGLSYKIISKEFPVLSDRIGRFGLDKEKARAFLKELKVNTEILDNVVQKSITFYTKQFGWSQEESVKRALTVACAYALESKEIRKRFKNPVVIYSAYSYERSFLYGDNDGLAKIGIIYPKRPVGDSIDATFPIW